MFPFLDIAPGESNEIGVRYNSVGKEGAQTAEVTVESNATPRKTIIKLKGVVMAKSESSNQENESSGQQWNILLASGFHDRKQRF